MTASLLGWYSWRRIGSDAVECVQYANATFYAAREEASRVTGVEAQGLVCEAAEEPADIVGYIAGIPLRECPRTGNLFIGSKRS